MPSHKPYMRFPAASPATEAAAVSNPFQDAIKASKYPVERKIKVLKAIINSIHEDGNVTFEGVYNYIQSVDVSYQPDEVKEAFDLLSGPLFVIKQEREGEYKLAMSMNELKERLWLLSKIFLESSNKSALPTKS